MPILDHEPWAPDNLAPGVSHHIPKGMPRQQLMVFIMLLRQRGAISGIATLEHAESAVSVTDDAIFHMMTTPPKRKR